MNTVILTNNGATLFVNGVPYAIANDHPRFDDIVNAARTSNWDALPAMIDVIKAVEEAVVASNNPDLKINGRSVIYKHVKIPEDLSEYIVNLVKEKLDLTPITRFMDKLLKNPDHRVFQQLYGFLAYGKNPITNDGNILAYKRVRADYTSVYDGKTSHKVGETVVEDRSKCDGDPTRTCSSGLHFCSREYLQHFGGDRIVILEISPEDVVSIPTDYNNTKGRACKYVVVGEVDANGKEILKTQDLLKKATVDSSYANVADDVAMYKTGYADGRKKRDQQYPGNKSYVEGYKDGRAHKAKKYL